jgi:putative sterol carrier protein
MAGLLVKDVNIAVQFTVKRGPAALLSFENGRCKLQKGKGRSDISLYFTSPEHLNKMFDGKANPIPLKGISKLSFLKNEFTKLTERLTYYLKPTDELLADPEYLKINTILTANTAFFALAEIGNNDRMGKLNASRIPDGDINICILSGELSLQLKARKGSLEAAKGACTSPRAIMNFADLEVANSMLNGKVDAYTCIASGAIQLKGYIPMIDNMNKLLTQVPEYLK